MIGRALILATLLLLPSLLSRAWLPLRLVRNAFLDGGRIDSLPPHYPLCRDQEIVSLVTVVAVVKDVCSHVDSFTLHLSPLLPSLTRFVYAFPSVPGCQDFVPLPIFSRTVIVRTPSTSSPFDAFLSARRHVRTPFVLLTHTDVYPMDRNSICELARALQVRPEAGVAAPHLLERGRDRNVVSHGHHANLHIRRGGGKDVVSYDLDWDLLTRRLTPDFGDLAGGPQVDFLEDHAFMARKESFHKYLDSFASYTMEYIDVVLNMRWEGTHPWYVPTSRFVFDVDTDKIRWQDVPYFVTKRSEHEGGCVSAYLTSKWSVDFPHTSVWNYVRYSMLSRVSFEGNLLPTKRRDQLPLFLSWFESVGFNSYSGKRMLTASRRVRQSSFLVARRRMRCPTLLPSSPRNASTLLSTQEKDVPLFDVSLDETWSPIYVSVTFSPRCADVSYCGMTVIDKRGDCTCYVYHPPFDRTSYSWIERLTRRAKLPSRAVDFARMKKKKRPPPPSTTYKCEADDLGCDPLPVRFEVGSKIVRWSWREENRPP